MPQATKVPCKHRGYPRCNALIPPGTRYCERHRRQYEREKHAKRNYDRYYESPEWRKLSRAYKREYSTCEATINGEVCGRAGFTCDHIKPRKLGGADHFDNLQTLCRRCDARKRAAEGQAADKARGTTASNRFKR